MDKQKKKWYNFFFQGQGSKKHLNKAHQNRRKEKGHIRKTKSLDEGVAATEGHARRRHRDRHLNNGTQEKGQQSEKALAKAREALAKRLKHELGPKKEEKTKLTLKVRTVPAH